uniref:Uncharacterized protein n=1 Tax=Branchiostoma floridae TaxID=7739 RepID=C3YUC2_BRAFL|eukprot:XP_002600030.1 hypothetical protein BRAFLDRAFT_79728 [Branchiostoma floridae]
MEEKEVEKEKKEEKEEEVKEVKEEEEEKEEKEEKEDKRQTDNGQTVTVSDVTVVVDDTSDIATDSIVDDLRKTECDVSVDDLRKTEDTCDITVHDTDKTQYGTGDMNDIGQNNAEDKAVRKNARGRARACVRAILRYPGDIHENSHPEHKNTTANTPAPLTKARRWVQVNGRVVNMLPSALIVRGTLIKSQDDTYRPDLMLPFPLILPQQWD